MRAVTTSIAVLLLTLTACTSGSSGEDPPSSSHEVDTEAAPETGLCHALTVEDIDSPSDETGPVPCKQAHTAETFFVGEFGDDATYDDKGLGKEVYRSCQKTWTKFTGADESLTLRSVLSWAWFRPTEEAWDQGAHWFRCDVVGGVDSPLGLVELPKTAKGILLGIPPDRWMACVNRQTVEGAPFVPCIEEHTWRAVSTIVVDKAKKYPGDRLVEVLSRDYCSRSVIAYLNYPPQYDYAYSYFGRAEWKLGNHRSICWALTGA